MLFEYKIQKVSDGNGKISFVIYMAKKSDQRFWKGKTWKKLDSYNSDHTHETLGDAQEIVAKEMKDDKKRQFNTNQKKITVLKEFTYTEIPNHIPEEQQENFCSLKGAEL